MLQPKYIVVHTAAYNGRNCDADLIDQWHRQRGWREIGYHFVVINDRHDHLEDGLVQVGRDINSIGAHARGLNAQSIGICCIGHGDQDPLTSAQKNSVIRLISRLIDEHEGISVEHVIGHRELNTLVNRGLIHTRYHVRKTCPGKKVDMDRLRSELSSYRNNPPTSRLTNQNTASVPEQDIRSALDVIEQVISRKLWV